MGWLCEAYPDFFVGALRDPQSSWLIAVDAIAAWQVGSRGGKSSAISTWCSCTSSYRRINGLKIDSFSCFEVAID